MCRGPLKHESIHLAIGWFAGALDEPFGCARRSVGNQRTPVAPCWSMKWKDGPGQTSADRTLAGRSRDVRLAGRLIDRLRQVLNARQRRPGPRLAWRLAGRGRRILRQRPTFKHTLDISGRRQSLPWAPPSRWKQQLGWARRDRECAGY